MGKAEAGSPSRRRLYRRHATPFRESCLHNSILQPIGQWRVGTRDPALDLQAPPDRGLRQNAVSGGLHDAARVLVALAIDQSLRSKVNHRIGNVEP
jgi:hypothetical protein